MAADLWVPETQSWVLTCDDAVRFGHLAATEAGSSSATLSGAPSPPRATPTTDERRDRPIRTARAQLDETMPLADRLEANGLFAFWRGDGGAVMAGVHR